MLRERTDMADTIAPIVDFLNRFNEALGIASPVEVEQNADGHRLNLSGEDAELLARHRGEPIKALQHVVDMAFGRDLPEDKRIFIDAGPGTPDGMRCDIDGNLWCGWGMGDPELDGVVVFAPDGVMIGRIALAERCANLCFGGLQRNRLFMAASQSIYALYVNTQGAPGG